jgi:aspartyl protease family protein
MRFLLCFAVFVAVVCIGLSREIGKFLPKPGGEPVAVMRPAVARPAPQPAPTSGYRTVTLKSDRHGHFQVEARVDGRRVDFLVDTGASMIALRESSAARLGIHPRASEYTVRMQTANGIGRAAAVQLNQVEIDGIRVRNVRAFVVADEALAVNLLGMSFLSHVKWTHDRGRLVLEQ